MHLRKSTIIALAIFRLQLALVLLTSLITGAQLLLTLYEYALQNYSLGDLFFWTRDFDNLRAFRVASFHTDIQRTFRRLIKHRSEASHRRDHKHIWRLSSFGCVFVVLYISFSPVTLQIRGAPTILESRAQHEGLEAVPQRNVRFRSQNVC